MADRLQAADYADKLAMLLRQMTFDRESARHRALLDAVCAALLEHLLQRARRGLTVRLIDGVPSMEPGLRDAAFVLGALWEPGRIERFALPDRIERYAARTADWLRPVVEAHNLTWRWEHPEERQVA